MEYEWYIDIFLLSNLLMEFSAMTAAAILLNVRLRVIRCLVFCVAGVIGSTVLLFVVKNYLIYCILTYILLNPLLATGIFGMRKVSEWIRSLLTVYLVYFVIGGVQNCVGNLSGNRPSEIMITGIMAATLFCIYEIRRKVTIRICEVELWLDDRKLQVHAYCDSGNLLRDPDNGKPVCILQKEVLAHFSTDIKIQKEIIYQTISSKKETIQLIVLDKMNIYQKGTVKEIKEPEIGLHVGEIMQYPRVQMLLHAAYM